MFSPIARAEKLIAAGEKEKAARLFAKGKDFRRATRYFAEVGNKKKAVETAFKVVLGPKAEIERDATPKHAGELLASAGCHKEAVFLFELAGAFELAAKSALKSGQKARAGFFFDRAKAWTKAATCYEQVGKPADALRVLDREVTRLQALRQQSANPQAARDLQRVERKRAELLGKLGQSHQAAAVMREVGASAPTAIRLEKEGKYREAVDAYVADEQFDEALRVVREQQGFEDRAAADILLQAERPAQAAKLYAAYGFSREAAAAWESAGSWLQAAQLWEGVREPAKAAEGFLRAAHFADAGRCFEAAGQLEKALQAHQKSGDDGAKIAAIQLKLDRPIEAAASFLKARKYLQAAKILLDQGLKRDALAALQQTPADHPSFAAANLQAVSLLFEQGQFEQALHRVRLLSADVAAGGEFGLDRLYWEGRTLEAMEKEPEARVCYEKLVRLAPGHRDAAHRLQDLVDRMASATLAGPAPASSESIQMPASAVIADNTEFGVGQVLAGRYQIQEELGRGGMGRVYRAFDTVLNETVAIKTLLQQLGLQGVEEARLLREVKICRKLSHPNIVRVHDVRRFPGGVFITMEMLQGKSLDRLLRGAKQATLRQTKSIVGQVAAGLAEAHALDIVHRDLKPGNVFIAGPKAKILDFGIARMEGTQTQLTQTGHILGSPHYMSPEQLQGQPLDGRSDLYALGILAFRLLAGHEPFQGDSIPAIALAHLQRPIPEIRDLRPEVPEAWSKFLSGLLAKDQEDRFASASECRTAVAALPDEPGPSDQVPTVDLQPPSGPSGT